mmetsp:Transcript_36540/g.79563  ORF Transcript_36540/g.79563 Transcript_36540/m.79563 type:complete len:288 (+) Transcript_36540:791-1654(+)
MESEGARDQSNEHCFSPAPEKQDDPMHIHVPCDAPGSSSADGIVESHRGNKGDKRPIDPPAIHWSPDREGASGRVLFQQPRRSNGPSRDANEGGNSPPVGELPHIPSTRSKVRDSWKLGKCLSILSPSNKSSCTDAGRKRSYGGSNLGESTRNSTSIAHTPVKVFSGKMVITASSYGAHYRANGISSNFEKKELSISIDSAHFRDGMTAALDKKNVNLNIDSKDFVGVCGKAVGVCDKAVDKFVGVCDKAVVSFTNVCYRAIHCALIAVVLSKCIGSIVEVLTFRGL